MIPLSLAPGSRHRFFGFSDEFGVGILLVDNGEVRYCYELPADAGDYVPLTVVRSDSERLYDVSLIRGVPVLIALVFEETGRGHATHLRIVPFGGGPPVEVTLDHSLRWQVTRLLGPSEAPSEVLCIAYRFVAGPDSQSRLIPAKYAVCRIHVGSGSIEPVRNVGVEQI